MPFDRPRKIELLGAVREFMEEKLLPELHGHLGFNTRVAINVIKMLERELETGDEISVQVRSRLQALLSSETTDVLALNHELCQAIDAGSFNDKNEALVAHLWQTTLDKLSVDNPRYVSYQKELNPA